MEQSVDDKITDYLKQIYHNPTDELSKINCTSVALFMFTVFNRYLI